jgi:hypothetical protein
MSAEEFVFDLDYSGAFNTRSQKVTRVRSRDSAMLEKYKEAVRKAEGAFVGNSGRLYTREDIFVILDSAFAEIEGGK